MSYYVVAIYRYRYLDDNIKIDKKGHGERIVDRESIKTFYLERIVKEDVGIDFWLVDDINKATREYNKVCCENYKDMLQSMHDMGCSLFSMKYKYIFKVEKKE